MKCIAAFGLLFLLVFVMLPAIPSVVATGSNRASIIYSSQWLQLDIDRNYILWACNDTCWLFKGLYTIAENYYDHVENFHAQTTWSIMSEKITHCEQEHTFATVLYIGHGGFLQMDGYYRYDIFEQAEHNDWTNPPPSIYDYWIYERTVNGKHRFVFLWACRQGNEPGSDSPAVHGMAYCWTHQPDLSEDGYGSPDNSPYCFIGFENASPRLSEWINENTNNRYKHWLVFFYYYALNGNSINNALDKASQIVGYDDWDDDANPLYSGFWTYWPFDGPMEKGYYQGRMRIYGNGNICLIG